MSKYKNFFLMLKQGIKGVFQFKAQFIIIIILAFVATFILSISVSTQRAMKSSYDKIVKKVPKFDFQGNIQTNSDANSNSDPYMLASEVDNSDPTDFKVTAGGHTFEEFSSFNFVLYNGGTDANPWYKDVQGERVDTFLTRGTADFLKAYKGKGLDALNGDFYKILNVYYTRELFNELGRISANAKKGITLAEDKTLSLTKYSPVAIFTSQNPDWYKPFVIDLNATSIDGMFKLTSETANTPYREILNNVLAGTATIPGFLENRVNDLKNSLSEPGAPKVGTIRVEDAVEYLFGTTLGTAGSAANNWVIGNGNIKPYSTNVTIASDSENNPDYTLATYNKDWKAETDGAIYNSGLRGITNPLIDGNSKESDDRLTGSNYNNVTNWDNFDYLSINVTGSSLYSNMNDVSSDWYSISLSGGNVDSVATGGWKMPIPYETAFRVHNELSSSVAGYDFKIRREATYFDANSQYKFRAIVLNSHENYNFTILSGRFPNTGEIAISEQFAKKNHIKVGDKITMGDAPFLVSALATDAMSYLPSQDLDNPIPNPSVSSFVYADKDTIQRMWGGSKTSSGSSNAVTQNLAYFLYDNNKAKVAGTKEQRKNAYLALYSTSKSDVLDNNAAIREFVNKGVVTSYVGSDIKYKTFDKSPYRYSNSLQPLVFKIYDAITFTAAAIIAIIAVISVIVCVNKTIDLNSKQIGILKALGEQPGGISVNYISYAMILGIIVVPLAWLIGNVLQIPFSNMFTTYFSVQPDIIDFDWISFVVAFAVLGIGAGVFSFLSAWVLTKKPVLKILMSSVKWGRLRFLEFLKFKVFKNAPFSTRFSLTLTSSGSRQIILMTVVMFIASLLMSLVLAIPSVVVRIETSYYKSAKYANQYTQVPMTGNAPLSKNAISYWNGHDYLDNEYVKANLPLDNSGAGYGYYKNEEAYTSTNSNGSAFPQYMYDATDTKNNGVEDFNRYLIGHVQQLLSIVGTVMGNNYFTHLGTTFSVGMVDKIYGMILHSLQDPTTMAEKDKNGNLLNKEYTDNKKLNESQNLSGWLTSSVPKIIGAIVGSFTGGGNSSSSNNNNGETETWKQKVMDAIYAVVPSYVKGYVQKSDSRLDQFGIAFDNEMYIPGQETLTTTVDNFGSKFNGNNSAMQLTGLDKYQNSLIVNNKDKDKVYLTKKDIKQIMNRINVPMKDGKPDTSVYTDYYAEKNPSLKLYDTSTNTFNIPVLPNEQAASFYNLDKGKEFTGWNNQVQLMQMNSLNDGWFDIPRTAWVYDDSDYVQYLQDKTDKLSQSFDKVPYANDPKYNSNDPNNNWVYDNSVSGKYYLDPSRLDNNKLTFTNEFSDPSENNGGYDYTVSNNIDGRKFNAVKAENRALFFKGFKYNSDGEPTGTYLRPYYQYKNFKLMVPKDWIDSDKLINSGRSSVDGKFGADPKSNQWYDDSVDAKYIPKSVKDGYAKLINANPKLSTTDPENTQYVVINPYDLTYLKNGYKQKMALTNLVSGSPYWYRYSFIGSSSIMRVPTNIQMNKMLSDTQGLGAGEDGKSKLPTPSVNLKSVGTIDSYNDKVIVCDSDLANLLLDYPITRDYQYNFQTFDKSTLVKAGEADPDHHYKSQFDRYKFVDTTKEAFLNDDWAADPKAKANDLWQLSWPKFQKAIEGGDIENYAPHLFYNGKLSNIDEPLEYTSQSSECVNPRIGQEAIGLKQGLGSGEVSIIQSSTLLSTTKNLIKQLALLAIAIVAMLMAAIIITAALLIMLTGDIYIEQYKRFMVLLRALGYSKVQIFLYTFAPVSIFSLVAWAGATVLAWGLVFIGVTALWNAGFAIPMGITWWPIVISFAVMFVSYAGSLWVSGSKTRKAAPSEVLTATAE